MIIKPSIQWDMGTQSKGLRSLGDIEIGDRFINRFKFTSPTLNDIFNGGEGLVRGQRINLAAPRGSGKTTLLLMAMEDLVLTNSDLKAAYISNEECVEQLAFTAKRLGTTHVLADNMTDVDAIAELMKDMDFMVIDSVAGLTCKHFTQEDMISKYALSTLCKAAEANECTTIFIQHFTKDGKEAGSTKWGHAVDTVILVNKMDTEDYGDGVREFCVDKNRFGSGKSTLLRMGSKGFDLNTIVEPVSKTPDAGGVYATARKNDTDAILRIIGTMSVAGGAKISDFNELNIDMGRVERLLKELVSSGRVTQYGGGKGQPKESKRWSLTRVTVEDDGDATVPIDFH